MERINENTIRVLIENDDLAERGITFLDLLGNHKQIETFFYSILEEVDVEEQFQETDAITFQVLPNRDGLELFISKNLADSEGTNFSELSEELDQEEITGFVKKQMLKGMDNDSESEELLENSPLVTTGVIFKLDSFESMIQLSKEIYVQNITTNLYKMDGDYFLHVSFFMEDISESELDNDISQLLEFSKATNVTPEMLEEYGQLLMERSALELTRYYFK